MNYPSRIIAIGDKDSSIVKEIQSQLNLVGCGPIDVDGIYGKNTFNAVKTFQGWHCDKRGNPLVIDGKVGSLTWASLFDIISTSSRATTELLAEVLKIAKKEIGVLEDPPGSNKGLRVEDYIRSVSRVPGDAWCAAFVYWCFDQACIQLTRQNPLVKTGICMEHWKKTAGEKIVSKDAIDNPLLVEPGCVFIINHGNGRGHTGLVVSIENGYINTIEGNTNNNHSAEGVGVFELHRKINTINAGFIRYS
jgi:hypothetical protein